MASSFAVSTPNRAPARLPDCSSSPLSSPPPSSFVDRIVTYLPPSSPPARVPTTPPPLLASSPPRLRSPSPPPSATNAAGPSLPHRRTAGPDHGWAATPPDQQEGSTSGPDGPNKPDEPNEPRPRQDTTPPRAITTTRSGRRVVRKRPADDDATPEKPPAKTSTSAVAAAAATKRAKREAAQWQPDVVLSNKRSPLINHDIRALLCKPEAWTVLSQDEQAAVLALFPAGAHNNIADAGTDRARPAIAALANDDNFRHDCARFRSDLEAGFFDRVWLADAFAAHALRARGRFDAYVVQEFETSWGLALPDAYRPDGMRVGSEGSDASWGGQQEQENQQAETLPEMQPEMLSKMQPKMQLLQDKGTGENSTVQTKPSERETPASPSQLDKDDEVEASKTGSEVPEDAAKAEVEAKAVETVKIEEVSEEARAAKAAEAVAVETAEATEEAGNAEEARAVEVAEAAEAEGEAEAAEEAKAVEAAKTHEAEEATKAEKAADVAEVAETTEAEAEAEAEAKAEAEAEAEADAALPAPIDTESMSTTKPESAANGLDPVVPMKWARQSRASTSGRGTAIAAAATAAAAAAASRRRLSKAAAPARAARARRTDDDMTLNTAAKKPEAKLPQRVVKKQKQKPAGKLKSAEIRQQETLFDWGFPVSDDDEAEANKAAAPNKTPVLAPPQIFLGDPLPASPKPQQGVETAEDADPDTDVDAGAHADADASVDQDGKPPQRPAKRAPRPPAKRRASSTVAVRGRKKKTGASPLRTD